MRELGDAIAAGALARVSVLRGERFTRDAQLLLDAIESPLGQLGKLPDNPQRLSPQAELRERFELERALLLMRVEREQSLAQARAILHGVLARLGPRCNEPSVDGPARMRLLNRLGIALSALGLEREAIRISEHLLVDAGVPPGTDVSAEYVREHPHLTRMVSRVTVELNNLSVRRRKLAFVAALAGDAGGAIDLLAAAHCEAVASLELRAKTPDAGAVSARLLGRTNVLVVELDARPSTRISTSGRRRLMSCAREPRASCRSPLTSPACGPRRGSCARRSSGWSSSSRPPSPSAAATPCIPALSRGPPASASGPASTSSSTKLTSRWRASCATAPRAVSRALRAKR